MQGSERDSAGICSGVQPKDIRGGRGPERGAALHIRALAVAAPGHGQLVRSASATHALALDLYQTVNYYSLMGRTSDARERLIAATIDLIWMESYGAVTVDAICERAGVKKGSFYHFFKSKEDLVVAALEAHWQSRRPTLDHLFSPALLPLERLRGYFSSVYTRQCELKAAKGRTLGCLFNSVGVTCGQHEQPAISRKVQEILAIYLGYYENALRDAAARGEIRAEDIPGTARALFALMEGVLAQARIQNDPELVRPLASLALQFLGVEENPRLTSPEIPVP